MIKKILLGVVTVIVVFVFVAALQPSEFSVSRTATIPAPPDVVFAHVNDLHKWQAWSPWAKLDPAMKQTYEGPEAGTGAVYRWAGNSEVGEGSMTITESRPNELIRMNLEFLKPIKALNMTEFTFKAEGNQTVVTWGMTGKNNLMAKAAHMVMNIDKIVGAQFDQGLSQLKYAAEANAGK